MRDLAPLRSTRSYRARSGCLQLGGVMNSFGNGVVLPFLVIYLHDVRGFGLGVAGLVVAVSAATQLTAGLARRAARRPARARAACSAAGLVMQAVGFGLFPLVRSPWHAFVLIAIEGAGSAGFWPSQSTLIARLTPAARRHAAFAQQRVTMNLGIGLGGARRRADRERRAARARSPSSSSSTRSTFLAYVAVLALVHDPGLADEDARVAGLVPRRCCATGCSSGSGRSTSSSSPRATRSSTSCRRSRATTRT